MSDHNNDTRITPGTAAEAGAMFLAPTHGETSSDNANDDDKMKKRYGIHFNKTVHLQSFLSLNIPSTKGPRNSSKQLILPFCRQTFYAIRL